MEKLTFKIKDINVDDAISIIVGFEISIQRHPERNYFTEKLETAISETKSEIIKLVGKDSFNLKYNAFASLLNPVQTKLN